jgi:hypothetical protein
MGVFYCVQLNLQMICDLDLLEDEISWTELNISHNSRPV